MSTRRRRSAAPQVTRLRLAARLMAMSAALGPTVAGAAQPQSTAPWPQMAAVSNVAIAELRCGYAPMGEALTLACPAGQRIVVQRAHW